MAASETMCKLVQYSLTERCTGSCGPGQTLALRLTNMIDDFNPGHGSVMSRHANTPHERPWCTASDSAP